MHEVYHCVNSCVCAILFVSMWLCVWFYTCACLCVGLYMCGTVGGYVCAVCGACHCVIMCGSVYVDMLCIYKTSICLC